MYMFSSRRVLAKSARALRDVISIAMPQSSCGKMPEMFWSSARKRPSIALEYVPIALVPWRYGSSAFFLFEVLIDAMDKF